MNSPPRIDILEVSSFVSALFNASGLAPDAARRVADALVEADMSGRGSHGVALADFYLARLVNGTMSRASEPATVSEKGGVVVLDAAEMEGHLAAEEATKIAVSKAREFGVAAVAMRRSFHCGVTGRYVRMAAEQDCAAIAMCNAKPIAAAPGGAERLVGTNPLAIGLPVLNDTPVVLDMATTAGTIGAIRQKLAAGEPLPEGWALDAQGNPTRDAATALEGLLLPAAGAKGFGLSFVIDMLSGLLSTGGWGPSLGEITGDQPYNSSFFMIAMNIAHFRSLDSFLEDARAAVERVHSSRMAPGTDRLYVPGERSAQAIKTSDGKISVSDKAINTLTQRAQTLGVPVPSAFA